MTHRPDATPAEIDINDVAPHSAEAPSPIDQFTGSFRARIETLLAQENLSPKTVNGHTILEAQDGSINALITPDQRLLKVGSKVVITNKNHEPDLKVGTLVEINKINPSHFPNNPIQVKVEKRDPGELKGYMDYVNVNAEDLKGA